MSGHSKWNNIKRTKEKSDAQKGKIFTKIGREIAVAVKIGGSDPSTNSKLADLIKKAKSSNMPNDTITRSIKKAAGELSNVNYEEITYEGYGIGGSAVIVKCLTDNKNRTAGDVRHAFDKNGGSLGATGCVQFMFDSKGLIKIEPKEELTEDDIFMIAIEANAEDVCYNEEYYEVVTAPQNLKEITSCLESQGLVVLESELILQPQNWVALEKDKLTSFLKMVDMLEDNDDVQEVIHNVNMPEDQDEE